MYLGKTRRWPYAKYTSSLNEFNKWVFFFLMKNRFIFLYLFFFLFFLYKGEKRIRWVAELYKSFLCEKSSTPIRKKTSEIQGLISHPRSTNKVLYIWIINQLGIKIMTSKWRSLLLIVSCYRPTSNGSSSSSSPSSCDADDSLEVKQSSSSCKRLSLSDVSDPSSWVSVDDFMIISSSFHGPKLHSFTLAELEAATTNFSRSNLIGEGGFGPVYKGFVDDELRLGLKAQPVAVKALNLDGLQGHKEWLVRAFWTCF